MKKFLYTLCSCCLCCLTVLVLSITPTQAKHATAPSGKSHSNSGGGTVCICHIPPGNPANAHTICIGAAAVGAHLRHGDTMGECPVTCDSGDDCHTNQFCKRADGVCAENARGTCTARPATCPATITPVCGCDGTTYDNACLAGAAGVTISHTGACVVECHGNADCHTNQFCKRPDGVCDESASGICTNRPAPCPTTITPVCGCDGTTYNNACEANAAGVTVSHAGECEVAGACGGASGATCGEGQFCKTELGACDANAEGVCTGIPAACPTNIDPVCGCNGETYSNACVADGAGVNVASAGACPEGVACGGAAGNTCAVGEFCKLEAGSCSADAEGVCTVIPGACPSSFIPVCGCDGQTYSNECFAASNGASVAAAGLCPQGAACVVGGGTCATGEFCRPAIGDCEASAAGHCTTIPEVCPPPISNIPVCGCNGVSYANPCAAFAAGVGIASEGECEADQQACGGAAGTCPAGEVCLRSLGECATDAEGICHPTPVACQGVINPVCGCDGVTYDNACVAAGAGATIASEGECGAPVEPVACDGATGVACPADQFCKHEDGACAADVEGVCTVKPLTCDPIDSKVCACGSIGFPNACYANAVGLNIQNTGVCAAPPEPVACDGTTGVTCPEHEFCKHADGACAATVEGVCSVKPLTCDPIDSKVCACGEIGFPNACYANAVGLNIANTGVCTP